MVSQEDGSSSDSSSNCFEIRFRDNPRLSSELTNMRQVFKLSMLLSADQETQSSCNQNKEDQTKKEDAVCAEHERVRYTRMKIDNGVEDGVEDLCVLENALEAAATTSFRGLSKFQKKMMVGNLKKLGVKKRRELSDEWKALVLEELQLNIKKQTFAGELANAMIC